jgi:Tol biopolymer transport system component
MLLAGGGYYAYQQGLIGGNQKPPAASQIEASLPIQTSPVPVLALANTSTPTNKILPTIAPTATDTQTPSPLPTDTMTPTPQPIIIGGADKIAYLNGSNVWVANLDGSELTQLTDDSVEKKYLRWLPGGQGLSYISGKCLQTVSLTKEQQVITCFNNAQYIDSLEVSPDGTQAVISLDRQLYLVPFDVQRLAEVDTHDELASLARCVDFAPYERNFAYGVDWSKDSKQWATHIMGVLDDGRRGDLIKVFAVDRCIPNPLVTVQFPPPHINMDQIQEYNRNPSLPGVAWDGESLFAFHTDVRNDGFGDLHIFNMETYKPSLYINPVNNHCCYRDPQWSPDGTHLLFAFQDYLQGANSTTQLYYIPFGSVGTGASFDPLPLPELSDPRESPQPVLRPALFP